MFFVKRTIRSEFITNFYDAINILSENRHVSDLTIDLNNARLGADSISALLTALSRVDIRRLTLKLNRNNLCLDAMNKLATFIQISHYGLSLTLRFNEIDSKGMVVLLNAITSGKCPNGLYIDLTGNLIDANGAIALANALKSPNWPLGLYIDLSGNLISTDVSSALMEAIQTYNPAGFYLSLEDNYINEGDLNKIDILLKQKRSESLRAYIIMELMQITKDPIVDLILMYLLKEKLHPNFKANLLATFFPAQSNFPKEKRLIDERIVGYCNYSG